MYVCMYLLVRSIRATSLFKSPPNTMMWFLLLLVVVSLTIGVLHFVHEVVYVYVWVKNTKFVKLRLFIISV